MKMYSVFDAKSGAWMRPIFANAHGEAIRFFQLEAERPDALMHKFGEDFVLFYIGEFDEEEGRVTGCEPLPLSRASEFTANSATAASEGIVPEQSPREKFIAEREDQDELDLKDRIREVS